MSEFNCFVHITNCLKNGQTLENRGTGWWLSGPDGSCGTLIDDRVIDDMEKSGLIAINLPYNTLKAVLCEQG